MSPNTLNIKIATPDGIVFSEVAHKVNLQTELGEITVLPDHTPLISILKKGDIKIAGEKKDFVVRSEKGIIEVRKGSEVIILSEGAEVA